MIQDLALIKEVFSTFGLGAIAVYLIIGLRRAWPALTRGSEWLASRYLTQLEKRVELDTLTNAKLTALMEKLVALSAELVDREKRGSEKIQRIEDQIAMIEAHLERQEDRESLLDKKKGEG